MSFRPFLAAAGVALALVSSAGLSVAEKARATLTRPDGKVADQTKKVKVFILLGQSNMLGFGRVGPKETKGSLEYLIHEKGMYGFLKAEGGDWAVRKDVRNVHVMDKR